MRDHEDNVVIVCSIENLDPMGVHTGDSITVAPAMTLTDREYQTMRDAAVAIIREVGVDAGGCNIQFAVNPRDGEMLVIEMNPRVSRSSALASKATGFPIARIGAKLAVGYRLDEIPNDITKTTPASFEPVLDYVVVKIPRFAFEKFPSASPYLTTQMKSVGEAMAIGRTFKEAFQKGLRVARERTPRLDGRAAPAGRSASRRNGRGAPRRAAAADAGAHLPGQARARARAVAWPRSTSSRDRSVVPGADGRADRGRARVRRVGRRDRRRHAPDEAHGLLGSPARRAARRGRDGGARASVGAGRSPVVQDGRHLRRRIPVVDAVPVRLLRRGERGAAERQAIGRHPRQRPESHRPGRRVRLLLRARRAGAARARDSRRS